MSAGSIGQQIINGTYGLDNRSPTAYEELKAWCEKYLPKENYEELNVSNGPSLWIGDTFFKFSSDGSFSFVDQRQAH